MKRADKDGNISVKNYDIFNFVALEKEPKQGIKDFNKETSERSMKMIDQRTWKEFRETGLLFLVNQFLHIFGWSIVIEYSNDEDKILDVYPARVKFRGFAGESVERGYKRISTFMKNNAEILEKEAYSDEEE